MNSTVISPNPKATGACERAELIQAMSPKPAPRFAVGENVFVHLLLGGLVPATAKARIETVEPGDSFAEVRFFKSDDDGATPTGHTSLAFFDEMYHAA